MTISISFSLSGCRMFLPYHTCYNGDYPELYTMACHIFDTEGYIFDGSVEDTLQVAIVPVETDNYGRTMFCYYDEYYYYPYLALLICQYCDDSYVYYYQDYNFINKEYEKDNGVHLVWIDYALKYHKHSTVDNPLYGFKDEDIANLKEWNDWDKPIDKSKCVSAEIFDDYADYTKNVRKGLNKKEESLIKPISESLCLDEGWRVGQYLYYMGQDMYNNIFIRITAYPISSSSQQPDKHRTYFGLISKSYGILSENSFTYVGEFYYSDHTYKDFYYSPAYLDALYNFHTNTYWNVCDLDDIIG